MPARTWSCRAVARRQALRTARPRGSGNPPPRHRTARPRSPDSCDVPRTAAAQLHGPHELLARRVVLFVAVRPVHIYEVDTVPGAVTPPLSVGVLGLGNRFVVRITG